jgi:DNA-nicking Smr family endonuclease
MPDLPTLWIFAVLSYDEVMCEDDDELWAHMMRDVQKIKRDRPVKDGGTSDPVTERPKAMAAKRGVTETVVTPKKVMGRGVDRKTAEKFRKGQMPIEGRLDLHGLRQDQAHETLKAFIGTSYHAGKRCVLVITGKGAGVDGRRDPLLQGQGVLKRKVPEWLDLPPLDAVVLKFEKARPQHGGDGALYVLLRRLR